MSNPAPAGNAPVPRPAAEIREWLVAKAAQAARIEPADVQTDEPLVGMGLDSMQFVVLVGELEDWLGARFADNPLYDHPTIDALSAFLAHRLARGETVIDPNRR